MWAFLSGNSVFPIRSNRRQRKTTFSNRNWQNTQPAWTDKKVAENSAKKPHQPFKVALGARKMAINSVWSGKKHEFWKFHHGEMELRLVKGKLNKDFLKFLPTFWHIWWFFKVEHFEDTAKLQIFCQKFVKNWRKEMLNMPYNKPNFGWF